MANWGKQTSSRVIKNNNSQWTGTGTITVTLGSETYQVRIFNQLPGWVAIDNGTALLGTAPSTAGGTGILLSTFVPESFTVSPGQTVTFAATSTSSGAWVNIVEMA
jgi:hypothetical protein